LLWRANNGFLLRDGWSIEAAKPACSVQHDAAGRRSSGIGRTLRGVATVSGKSAKSCQAPFAKIFLFFRMANQVYKSDVPCPQEGRFAIVTNVG
jgi:hypothetical protein